MRHMVLKISSLALIFAILILSVNLASAGFKSADIDGNNLVDIVDLVMARDAVNASADVNNDGAINDIDVNFVKNLLGTIIGTLSRVSDVNINRKFAPPGHTVTVTIKVFDLDGTDALPLEGTTVTLSGKEIQPIEMDYIGAQNNKDPGFYQASFKMPDADPVSIQIITRKGPSFIQTLPPEAVRLLSCTDSDGENINTVGTARGSNDAFSDFASISDSCQGEILKNTENNGGFRPLVAEAVCLSDRRASTKTIQCPDGQGCINSACQRLPDDEYGGGDGVLDPFDNCPDEYGSPEKAGCPLCSQFNEPVCQSRPSECVPVYENVKEFVSCNSAKICGILNKDRCQANSQYCRADIRYEWKCIGVRAFGICLGILSKDEIFQGCADNYDCNQYKDARSCISPEVKYQVKRGSSSFTYSNRVCSADQRDTQVFRQCLESGQPSPNPRYTPLRLDSDTDGLIDAYDSCPTDSGPLENKGCPISNPCTSLTPEACGQRADCKVETRDEESCQKPFLIFWCRSKTINTVRYCAGTQCNLPRDQCIQEYTKCTLRNVDSNECVTSKTGLAKKVIDACAGKTTDLACVKGDNMDYVVACDTKQVREIGPKGSCEKDKSIVGVQVKIENGIPVESSATSIKDLAKFKGNTILIMPDNKDYKDSDEDGIPDQSDRCKTISGTTELEGCTCEGLYQTNQECNLQYCMELYERLEVYLQRGDFVNYKGCVNRPTDDLTSDRKKLNCQGGEYLGGGWFIEGVGINSACVEKYGRYYYASYSCIQLTGKGTKWYSNDPEKVSNVPYGDKTAESCTIAKTTKETAGTQTPVPPSTRPTTTTPTTGGTCAATQGTASGCGNCWMDSNKNSAFCSGLCAATQGTASGCGNCWMDSNKNSKFCAG